MLTHSKLSRMSNVLGEGFFADNVVRMLRRKEQLKTEQKALLQQILDYVSRIENGKKQVSTGKLSDNATASISAYSRMLSIIVRTSTNQVDKEVIDELTRTIRKEVEETLKGKIILPNKLNKTMAFFQLIREATLQESASAFGWENTILSIPERAP